MTFLDSLDQDQGGATRLDSLGRSASAVVLWVALVACLAAMGVVIGDLARGGASGLCTGGGATLTNTKVALLDFE